MRAESFGSGTEWYSQVALYMIVVFLSISMYNVIELTFVIWSTFKRHSGLYFWSFLGASWGIPVYAGGFLIKYFAPASLGYLAATFISFGWVAMVSGQSLVLWSRLHLLLRNRNRLRMILWIILVDGFLCHGAIIPMIYGSFSNHPEMWKQPYNVMEKIQVSIFFVQEIVISCFYIFETVKLMKLERTVGNGQASRRLMNHLIFVNIVIILLDMTILGLEYADMYQYQTSYKALVYSTKLKLEFTILNRLVEMTTGNRDASSDPRSRTQPTVKTAIGLDTFHSGHVTKPSGDVAYQAYAMGGEEGGSSGSQQFPPRAPCDAGVMMTTEIMVRREVRDDASSEERNSSVESTIGSSKAYSREVTSKSSSEIHLATRGY